MIPTELNPLTPAPQVVHSVFLVHPSPDIYFLDSSYDPVIKHDVLPYPVLVVY